MFSLFCICRGIWAFWFFLVWFMTLYLCHPGWDMFSQSIAVCHLTFQIYLPVCILHGCSICDLCNSLSWTSPHKIPRHLFCYDQSRNHYLWDATTGSPLSLYLACTHAAVDQTMEADRHPIRLVFYTVYIWSSLLPNTIAFKHQTLLHHHDLQPFYTSFNVGCLW